MRKGLIASAVMMLAAVPARADLHTEQVTYRKADAVLHGYLAYDDAVPGRRPGVLVVHEWTGLGPYAKSRAEQLAKLGYAAFAVDIYGEGLYTEDRAQAAKLAGKYKSDRDLLRARVTAGFEVLKGLKQVDPKRTAAIGYCFGGTTCLELARSGADVSGVVSFHGGLSTLPGESSHIKTKVLVLHGADDPFVPPDEVAGFIKEMKTGKVDWEMVAYGGAVHGFTNPKAGSDVSKGFAYNGPADRRSWEAMKAFFREIFGRPE